MSWKCRSKTIQNELIEIIGEQRYEKILEEVKQARLFTDEVADVSNEEELSLVLRLVDSSSQIQEGFLEFVSCSELTTGEKLSEIMLAILRSHGLDIELLRGQEYDGAGVMSGRTRDVAARIQREFPKALYVHCYSHKLNLAIMKSCDIVTIRNAFRVINKVANFFNYSPK